MRRELPTGTVTFLFTDVEGSTRLLEELGPRYAESLAEHRRVVREAVARHGGVEVDTQGDAFFCAFARAADALAAAEEAQRELELPVRMGIHTGEPQLTQEGYVGIDVHRAARIAAAAHGGQVLVSERSVALLDGASDAVLRELGLHRLKDLGEPVKLYQLGDGEFPPLRSLNATNLPAQPPIVGRAAELAELAAVIRRERTVTLTGPGGSGKTRLALQAAAEAVDDFVDGVFWVPLAAVADAALVEPAIGDTIGAKNGVAAHVDEKRMLLLLDNLEQLLPDAAPVVAGIVERCPNLRLLSTSRAPLRIAGEREYAVEPLPETDAVTLFRERAFVSEPEEAVHEICRRLDGLPLAVELAAARTRALPPDRLLARLDQALPVLTGGRRDAPERQRTLRATIEWSYDLLDDDEKRLFARLGVFAGSFDAEAVEAVCDADLDTLEALVEHSLVRRWASGRLGMLETIRELAVEKLDLSGEAEAIRRRHAEYLLALAESAGLGLATLGKLPQRYDLVLPELPNLRAAMDWAVDADPELGLRIAVGIEQVWVTHDPKEGIHRFETLLGRAGDIDPDLRARALLDLGGCSEWSGDSKKGRAAYEEALALRRQLGDERGVAEARFRLGVVDSREGDLESARTRWQQSLEEWQRLGDEAGVAQGLGNLGWLAFVDGDLQRARELTEQGLVIARRLGWTWWEAGGVSTLAEVELQEGSVEEGDRFARQALEISARIQDRTHTLYGLALLAWAAAQAGEDERAARLWASVEAELDRAPEAQLEQEREVFAGRMPAGVECAPLELEEAVAYALADD